MKNILINEDFGKSIKRLRAILPILSFSLLILTYLISAIIMGIFHAQKADGIGFTIAAYLVPLAIQAGRGTLVFFFQLNPMNIQGRFSFGLIAATVLLILSLVESYLVMAPYGLPWIISVSTLMGIGWVIEIMILKETIFATQVELYQDQEKWEEIKAFYTAQKKLKLFLSETDVPTNQPLIAEPQNNDDSKEDNPALALLEELNQQLQGKDLSPSLNGKEKGKK